MTGVNDLDQGPEEELTARLAAPRVPSVTPNDVLVGRRADAWLADVEDDLDTIPAPPPDLEGPEELEAF